MKNFWKMEACYNKWCSCPIYKSYWYVSYSSLLFVQWVPVNRHLSCADAWSRFALDLLFCTHRNHAFLTVFRPSGPLARPRPCANFILWSNWGVPTPLWMSCYCFAGLPPSPLPPPPAQTSLVPIHAGGERHCESKMLCVRTWHHEPDVGLETKPKMYGEHKGDLCSKWKKQISSLFSLTHRIHLW